MGGEGGGEVGGRGGGNCRQRYNELDRAGRVLGPSSKSQKREARAPAGIKDANAPHKRMRIKEGGGGGRRKEEDGGGGRRGERGRKEGTEWITGW